MRRRPIPYDSYWLPSDSHTTTLHLSSDCPTTLTRLFPCLQHAACILSPFVRKRQLDQSKPHPTGRPLTRLRHERTSERAPARTPSLPCFAELGDTFTAVADLQLGLGVGRCQIMCWAYSAFTFCLRSVSLVCALGSKAPRLTRVLSTVSAFTRLRILGSLRRCLCNASTDARSMLLVRRGRSTNEDVWCEAGGQTVGLSNAWSAKCCIYPVLGEVR